MPKKSQSTFKYINWMTVIVGAIVVTVVQLATSWLFSYFNLNLAGAIGQYATAFIVGLAAYFFFSMIRGFKITIFLALLFSIMFVVSKSLVIAVGFIGGEGSIPTYIVTGALTSAIYSIALGSYIMRRLKR